MGNFIIHELGSPADGERVDNLTAAKISAQRRARESQRPVIVRDGTTGEELARYEPSSGSAIDSMSPVLVRLRDVHKRLQKTLDRVAESPSKKRS